MDKSKRAGAALLFGWLLAVAGALSCGCWTYWFYSMTASYLYLGGISIGVQATIAEICLIAAELLRILAAVRICRNRDQSRMAESQRMTILSFWLYIAFEVLNYLWYTIIILALANNNPEAAFYGWFLLTDMLTFVFSIVQIVLLSPWKKRKTAGGWHGARKLIISCVLAGVLFTGIISLASGVPIIKDKAELRKIDAFTDFEMKDFSGNTVTQADLAGKVTLLNIWETTCGPCKNEMPALESVSQSISGTNVQIWGLCYDVSDENGEVSSLFEEAQTILNERGVTYCNLIPNQTVTEKLQNCITAFPTTIIIDEQGQVLEVLTGAREEEEWLILAQKYIK